MRSEIVIAGTLQPLFCSLFFLLSPSAILSFPRFPESRPSSPQKTPAVNAVLANEVGATVEMCELDWHSRGRLTVLVSQWATDYQLRFGTELPELHAFNYDSMFLTSARTANIKKPFIFSNNSGGERCVL